MKSMKSLYETTFTSTSDSTMTGDYGEAEAVQDSPSTTNQRLTPSYYLGKYKGIEAFDVCMDFARDSYNMGVAIAYLLRAGKKEGNPKSQDIRKAIHHLEKELEYEGIDPTPQATQDSKS
jgi:hypothetical protein